MPISFSSSRSLEDFDTLAATSVEFYEFKYNDIVYCLRPLELYKPLQIDHFLFSPTIEYF